MLMKVLGCQPIEDGDLTPVIESVVRERHNRLRAIVDIWGELCHPLISIVQTTHELHESRTYMQSISAAVQQMTVAIGEIAHIMDDISRNITSSGMDDKDHVIGNLNRCVQMATDGTGAIDALVSTMQSLSVQVVELMNDSNQITQIIGQLKDITSRTNMLALNTQIEATRAGEVGKGFNVIAIEVKSLATKSREAGEMISRQLTYLADKIKEAASGMETTKAPMDESAEAFHGIVRVMVSVQSEVTAVLQRVTDVAAILQQQEAVVREIAQNIERVANMSESNLQVIMNVVRSADNL